jgi:hypothetical protein
MLWGPCTAIILEAACRVGMFFSFWFALVGALPVHIQGPFFKAELFSDARFCVILTVLCAFPR